MVQTNPEGGQLKKVYDSYHNVIEERSVAKTGFVDPDIVVSYEATRQWRVKFGQDYANKI